MKGSTSPAGLDAQDKLSAWRSNLPQAQAQPQPQRQWQMPQMPTGVGQSGVPLPASQPAQPASLWADGNIPTKEQYMDQMRSVHGTTPPGVWDVVGSARPGDPGGGSGALMARMLMGMPIAGMSGGMRGSGNR